MNVRKMMRTDIAIVSPDTVFPDLLCRLALSPYRQLYVARDDKRLLGIITSYDLIKALSPFYLDSTVARAITQDESIILKSFKANLDKKASDLMNARYSSLKPEDSFIEADLMIKEKGIITIPVLENGGTLIGEISRKDILRYFAVECCGLTCDGLE